MPAPTVSTPDVTVLTRIRKADAKLRQELTAREEVLRRDANEAEEFVRRVDGLFKHMRRRVQRMRTTAEFEWLSRAASEWQVAFTTILRIPRNIRAELGVTTPPPNLELSRVSQGEALKSDQLEVILKSHAHQRGQMRTLMGLMRRVYELQMEPNRIYGLMPSSPEEQQQDWHHACVSLADDVLSGGIHLALQLDVGAFEHLRGVWLEDVKRFRAYLDWENSGALFPDDQEQHYWNACRDVHARMLDPSLKAGRENFRPIERWIKDNILSGETVDISGKPFARELVRRKAERIWQSTLRCDAAINWQTAEKYVRDFYEHLIPAVLNGAAYDVETVLSAMDVGSSGVNCEIVDALEASLVAYFLDPELTREHFDTHCSYV